MITLLLAATLNCPTPQVINFTNEWIEEDERALTQNIDFCQRKAREDKEFKDAPCLTYFIKREKLVYRIWCGKEV